MNDIDDLILKTQHYIEARGNALADELVATLQGAKEVIVGRMAELQARHLTGKPWEAESYARKRAYLEAQREVIDKLIAEIYAEMPRKAVEAAFDSMAYAEEEIGQGLAQITSNHLSIAEVTLAAVAAWAAVKTIDGLLITEWFDKLSKSTADRIVMAGREALILGLPLQGTARLIHQKGIEGGIPTLEAISRTFLHAASKQANEAVIERNSDLIDSVRYDAILDGRTCAICGVDDGKVYRLDEPRPDLPRHLSCRCHYHSMIGKAHNIPPLVMKDGTVLDGRTAHKHEKRTVHHRDGTTSTKFKGKSVERTKETYSQWITRQVKEDPEFARKVLGKTRFELIRDGKLTLERMVVDGRIKRLSELGK